MLKNPNLSRKLINSTNFFFKSLGVIFILLTLFAYTKKEDILSAYRNMTSLKQEITAIQLEPHYTLGGEVIPMDQFDLRERMERELLINAYHHATTIQHMKLARRYFPTIEKILKENNIPEDFKYLAVAESSLRYNTSSAGAKGIWQFMTNTFKELNYEISDDVDERYHLEKSTQAACDYLNKLYKRFGSWVSVAAAYNTGPSKYAQYLKDQNAESYFDVNISDETMRYPFRILAIKTIMENPQKFGYHIPEEEKYAPLDDYNMVRVDSTVVNLADFAKQQGISYRALKIYNPWLRSSSLKVNKDAMYEIKVPVLKPKSE
jgi:membrane-bound lytic murein transglycosylase D